MADVYEHACVCVGVCVYLLGSIVLYAGVWHRCGGVSLSSSANVSDRDGQRSGGDPEDGDVLELEVVWVLVAGVGYLHRQYSL